MCTPTVLLYSHHYSTCTGGSPAAHTVIILISVNNMNTILGANVYATCWKEMDFSLFLWVLVDIFLAVASIAAALIRSFMASSVGTEEYDDCRLSSARCSRNNNNVAKPQSVTVHSTNPEAMTKFVKGK